MQETQTLCDICQKQFSKYICPRCNLKYCSLPCYKHPKHTECTETFYRDNVMSEIQSRPAGDAEKQRMMQLLRRFEAQGDTDAIEDDEQDELGARLAQLDLTEADPATIWNCLSEEEQKEFQALVQNDGVDYEPWWQQKQQVIQEEIDVSLDRPPLPQPVPDLNNMVKKVPPETLAWNVVHLTCVYSYMMRHCVGDLHDDPPHLVSRLSQLSSRVLYASDQYTYPDAGQAVLDTVERTEEKEARPALHALLLRDVLDLLDKDYLVRALAHLWHALQHASKQIPKPRKQTLLAARKAEFYTAYAAFFIRQPLLNKVQFAVKLEQERVSADAERFEKERLAAAEALKMQKAKSTKKVVIQDIP
ncbi:hypothetical protein BCR43DRAFT_521976 [Syncephalastrum racemosum]|uniref:HIT-type domain-containing protein n=1 Tax=Syncephalastrum racemosum TaxID=13706 RepID=A0A1X2HQ92_SYNRA|nr:hypothetical protein BCR43DRAFT_521976 [Syncephalastrum racemosum]